MSLVESIAGFALEALLLVAVVAIGVPLLMLLVWLVRGEFAPRQLKEQFRRGKEDVDER